MTNTNDNPLLIHDGLPPFDCIEADHILPAMNTLLHKSASMLEELEKQIQPSWSATIEKLDTIDILFEYSWSPVSHFLGVKNSAQLRKAHEEILSDVVAFGLKLRQSRPVYDALLELKSGDAWDELDSVQKRIIETKLLDCRMAGIDLDDDKKKRFNEIVQELSQLSTDFSNHVLDATKAYELVIAETNDAEGFPESLRRLSSQTYHDKHDGASSTPENGPWSITLELPIFVPFMQFCKNRELREQVYRAFVTRASSGEWDNSETIAQILRLRKEKAALIGYETPADASLAKKMAHDVAAVEKMFDDLLKSSKHHAEHDLEELQQLANEAGQTESLWHWDIAYWSERLRENRFDYSEEDLRPYFSLPNVLKGLFDLSQRLFGMTIRKADGDAPVWHGDVRFFKLFDENETHIASFYLDPYSRPENKRGGAWMNDCLTRRRVDGKLQVPVAHLVCNSTPPVEGKPSLMTFREVETLFHEFGHGLQHMLTTVDYADAAGISGIEWDAVELPSQFMENWCYHKPTLMGIAKHYETGETLPEDLFEKVKAARTFRAGSQMMRQLQLGMIDMELHTRFNPDGEETAFDVSQRVTEKTSVLPPLPENRFLCSFQHIFSGGYAAGYYSYKWAEVLSADAFSAFEEAGLDDEQAIAKTGRRFRDTVLASGGGKHPMDVFRDFRGREPNVAALLRHNGLD